MALIQSLGRNTSHMKNAKRKARLRDGDDSGWSRSSTAYGISLTHSGLADDSDGGSPRGELCILSPVYRAGC